MFVIIGFYCIFRTTISFFTITKQQTEEKEKSNIKRERRGKPVKENLEMEKLFFLSSNDIKLKGLLAVEYSYIDRRDKIRSF